MSYRTGYAAIVGRPNVGKSTLLNALVGTKLAIVTPKPQTTRNRIVGICTRPDAQIIFLDTPGIHPARSGLNRRMVETARQTLGEADVVLLVLDATSGVTPADRTLATELAALRPVPVVVLNKLDRVAKSRLLPMMATMGECLPGRDVVPASARTGEGTAVLLDLVAAALPEGERLYPEEHYTTATERFLAQELVREKLFLTLGEEVPYGTAVVFEEFVEKPDQHLVVVRATILVEREGHKAIVIGAGGARLRDIGTCARRGLEALCEKRVFLELFVRAEPGWAENPRRLAELGL